MPASRRQPYRPTALKFVLISRLAPLPVGYHSNQCNAKIENARSLVLDGDQRNTQGLAMIQQDHMLVDLLGF